MKKNFATVIFLVLCGCVPAGMPAMANPEIIQWRAQAPVFVESVYQAVLGRNPGPLDLNALAGVDMNNTNARWNLFMNLLGSAEYQSQWGHLASKYNVYWETRWVDSESGRRMCHCYYFAEFASGYMPSMQYTGFPYPAGKLTFPVARALVLLYALFDRETCPHYDCGFQGEGGGGQVNPPTRQNLVRQGNFSGFGQGGGPWGTGLYSQNGIWWNSRNAGSSAQVVNLNENQRPAGGTASALYIRNPSGRSPNVFGTTSQRIAVIPGQTYEIRLLASANNLATNGGVNIAVDPAWRVRPLHLPQGSYGWTEFTGSFTADANFIDLRIISEDRGEVWITDVSMVAI